VYSADFMATPEEVTVLMQWLGEVHGLDLLVVPVLQRDALMDAATRLLMWGRGDIPGVGRAMSADSVAFFTALFVEMAEPARGIAGDFRGTPTIRFVRWAREGAMPELAVGATTPVIITRECQADMDAQGALFPRFLLWLELAMYLGRHVAEKELVGGQHAAPAQMMDGGKQAKKVGIETLDLVVVRARMDGSLAPLEVHYSRTMAHWSSCGHPFAALAAGLLMDWWQTVKRTNNNDPRAVLEYVTEYRSFYVGRGLPVMHDARIQASVTANTVKRALEEVAGGGKQVAQARESAGVVEALETMSKKLSELVVESKSQQRQLDQQQRQVDNIRNHVREGTKPGDGGGGGGGGGGGDGSGSGRNGGGDRDPPKCYNCGKKGHIAMFCPDK
jgi:uncharacterized membrane protein YgcG